MSKRKGRDLKTPLHVFILDEHDEALTAQHKAIEVPTKHTHVFKVVA